MRSTLDAPAGLIEVPCIHPENLGGAEPPYPPRAMISRLAASMAASFVEYIEP
jgi:hypothetical protein